MINKKRLAEEFTRQAAIASPSFREGEISRYLIERLEALGAEIVMDDTAGEIGGESGNLIAYFPASGRECEPFMLSAHMDTVEPVDGVVPVFKDGVFTSQGDTVLGADDKAGLCEIIEAISVLKDQQIPHGPIEVVITVCEEIGLLGAKHLDLSRIRSRRGLALDTNGVDRVIHKAPCANKFRFEVTGREAHAGVAPELGLSAIEVAAKAISKMRLGRVDEETSANIGLIRGGQATNIIPNRVILEGEARSHDSEKLVRQTEHMVTCLEEATRELEKDIDGETVRAQVKVEVLADYPLMAVPRDSALIALVEEASGALGRTIAVQAAGGGSDANIFNGGGIETLILGCGMQHVHTLNESVSLDDMVRVSELLVEVLRRA